MSDLTISAKLGFTKGNGTPVLSQPNDLSVSIAGGFVIKNRINVGASDETIILGDLPNIGWCHFENIASGGPPPSVDPVITQAGTSGAIEYDYLLAFHYADGSLSISNQIQTLLGNATLNSTNYNILTWTNPSGVVTVDAYRLVVGAGGSPTSLGKLTAVATSPFHDIGLTGDGSAAPSVISTLAEIQIGIVSGTYPWHLFAGEACVQRVNGAAIHVKYLGPPMTDPNFQYLIAPQ